MRRRTERGFALFLAILVLLVVTISGIALMFNSQIEQSLSATETKVSKAFYAADSGISWAGEQLRTNAQFTGGNLPNGVYSNIQGQSIQGVAATGDITVTVTQPVVVGYTRHPGDQIGSAGSSYNPQDIVENFYHLSSTATSTNIQASKTITTDVGIYPQQLQIAPH